MPTLYSSREDLGNLCWVRAAKGASESETGLLVPDVIAMVDSGVFELAQEVWESNFDRERMYKTFSVTLAGTTGGARATLDPTCITESLDPKMGGYVYSATLEALGLSGYLDYVQSITDVSIPHNFGFIGQYTYRGGDSQAPEIICFDSTGQGGIFNGANVSVKVAVHYTFSTVPQHYESRLVEIITRMAQEKMSGITRVSERIPGGVPSDYPTK